MNRINLALVTPIDEVLHHRVADLAVLRRGSDHRDRVGLHDAVHRAQDFLLRRAITRLGRRKIHDDAHVGRDRTVGPREHRIQIEFLNFREIRRQRRHRNDYLRDRLAIGRRRPAHPAQNLRGRDAVDHRQRLRFARRRQAERHVLQHFDQHSAESERDHLAEARIGQRTDDHFMATGQHLLNLHARDFRAGLVCLRVADDRVVGLARFDCALHPDDHAPRVGLVQDVGRHDFHHHRKADIACDLRRLRARCRDPLLRQWNLVGVAQDSALGRAQ